MKRFYAAALALMILGGTGYAAAVMTSAPAAAGNSDW
jgi:hypothetical protein